MLGTATGLAVAVGGVRLLAAFSPIEVPRLAAVAVDRRVLGFAALIAGATAVACGLVPALLMARADIQAPLKEAGRGADGGRARGPELLVAGEIGLAVLLLVGAALVARGFTRLDRRGPGVSTDERGGDERRAPVHLQRLRRGHRFLQPRDRSRSSAAGHHGERRHQLPPVRTGVADAICGQRPPPAGSGEEPLAQHQTVDEQYFQAIGVPLLKGRFFTDRESRRARS